MKESAIQVGDLLRTRVKTAAQPVIRFFINKYSTDDVASSYRKNKRVFLQSIVSLKSFEIAKRWIRTCQDTHNECPRVWIAELPTRLVEISPSGSPLFARLLTTRGHRGQYACLSYCWGGPQHFATTTANLEAYHKMLPYSDIPKTIIDSFEVTRGLGFNLIWIDSLCIVQDDKSDVQREMGQMLRVYQNARVTISAANASTCQEGFLKEKFSPDGPFHLPVRVHGDKFGSLIVRPQSSLFTGGGKWKTYISTPQPINSRAWTLQESFVSPCLLIFTNNSLYWKCPSAFLSRDDSLPEWMQWEKQSKHWGFISPSRNGILVEADHTTLSKGEQGSLLQRLRKEWINILENYTKRGISVGSDRLPAIAAVAEVFSSTFQTKYVAGLWESTLLFDLAWRPISTPNPRPKTYQGPSWSWASLNNGISFDEKFSPGSSNISIYARVLACNVIPLTEESPWGSVSTGELSVEGHLEEVQLCPRISSLRFVSTGAIASGFKLDVSDDGWVESSDGLYVSSTLYSDIWLLSLGAEIMPSNWTREDISEDRPGPEVYGLILGRISLDKEHYRRLARFGSKFEDLKTYPAWALDLESSEKIVVQII